MKLKKLIAAALLAGCASAAISAPAIRFLIDGDTFSSAFKITNLSRSGGEQITSFSLTLPTGFVFDISGTGPSNQGRYSFPNTNLFPIAAGSQQPTDGGNSLTFQFGSQFTSSCPAASPSDCVFGWVVDVDGASGTPGNIDLSVFGNQLIGAAVSATFSDGTSARGLLGACTNPAVPCGSQGAYWQAEGTVPPPNQTPEPGSLALAGLALLAAGALRARKA